MTRGIVEDVRYGLRQLRRSPGFTAVAVLTLALGIGANTAIFSVVHAVVLAPLRYRQPDRLVMVLLYNQNLKHATYLSYPDFVDWKSRSRSFEEMAAYSHEAYDLSSPGAPTHVEGLRISARFLATFGVHPALGRDFTVSDDQVGAAPVAMISTELWRSQFGANPNVIGSEVTLSGAAYTIVGVLPASFRFAERAEVYTPLGQRGALFHNENDRTVHDVGCVARLRGEVSLESARAEMNAVQEGIDRIYPKTESGLGVDIIPLKEALVDDVRGILELLLAAVGVVLLIACANVANLLLTRAAERSREFAIRVALGARRGRIVRQLIIESGLLTLAGACVGVAAADAGLHALRAFVAASLPRSGEIAMNASVLVFAVSISAAVVLLAGLLPAVRSSTPNLALVLKEGARGSTRSDRPQARLITAQVALTLVLLISAGLLLRTIRNLWQVDPGFDAEHMISFQVGLSPSRMGSAQQQLAAYRQLVERIRQLPGVKGAEITNLVPLSNRDNSGGFWLSGQPHGSVAEAPRALFYWTGPGYLAASGIPLLRGRFLADGDKLGGEPVIVIDSVFANTYFRDQDAVGQSIVVPQWGTVRIVGVVGHVHHWQLGSVDTFSRNQIYASYYQLPTKVLPAFLPDLQIVVRTPLEEASLIGEVKTVVYGSSGDQTIYNVRNLRLNVEQSMSGQRLPMILLGMFAALALLLAVVGLYGVVSYAVALRTHEIGVRMALGAQHSAVFRMIVGHAARLTIAGLAVGLFVTLGLTRVLTSFSSLLYGVSAHDPLTFGAVSLLLLTCAVAAAYVPARRAARIDPMCALRQE